LVETNKFSIRVTNCSNAFRLAFSCSKASLSLAHSESMVPNVLLTLVRDLWRSSNSFS
jgi:hypothetical protein